MSTRSVRARHIRHMGSGRRSADAVRTSALVLAVAGVATLGGRRDGNAREADGSDSGSSTLTRVNARGGDV